jgi:hypothetical protein
MKEIGHAENARVGPNRFVVTVDAPDFLKLAIQACSLIQEINSL